MIKVFEKKGNIILECSCGLVHEVKQSESGLKVSSKIKRKNPKQLGKNGIPKTEAVKESKETPIEKKSKETKPLSFFERLRNG